MDNVQSNQTLRFLTQETDSISIVPTFKGSDSTLLIQLLASANQQKFRFVIIQ